MTRVFAAQEAGRFTLRAEGHAQYHPGGDIVCAGCSALCFALLGWIVNHPEEVEDTDEMICESGRVSLSVTGGEGLKNAMELVVIGLLEIEKAYPDYVCVNAKNFV